FFQAEDGIRVFHVTGVQTCALPISRSSATEWVMHRSFHATAPLVRQVPRPARPSLTGPPTRPTTGRQRQQPRTARRTSPPLGLRSEERRVGKGWRCLGTRNHLDRTL